MKRPLLFWIGIGTLLFSLTLYHHGKQFLRNAATAQGVITEVVKEPNYGDYSRHSSLWRYRPRVRFSDEKGREFVFLSPTSNSYPTYQVGQTVDLLYDPINPNAAQLRGFFSQWAGPLFGAIFGISLILSGLGKID